LYHNNVLEADPNTPSNLLCVNYLDSSTLAKFGNNPTCVVSTVPDSKSFVITLGSGTTVNSPDNIDFKSNKI